jgi:uncharacterized protein (TIGR03435 family)
MRLHGVIGIGLVISLVMGALAQSKENLPRFEAADVHSSPAGVTPLSVGGFVRGTRYLFPSATMLELIASAYGGVGKEKVTGGPSWLESDRFDVVAKVAAGTTDATARLMLRSLLADRFELVVHNDNVALTAYALTTREAWTGAE